MANTHASSLLAAAYNDLVEFVPDLTFPASAHVYSRMRTDPQLASLLAAVTLPIRRATWAIDPGDASPAVAAEVGSNLGLPVRGQDHTGFQGQPGLKWADFIRLACLHLIYGCMGFEKVYDTSTGTARLTSVAERMPSSIVSLDVDLKSNELLSIEQFGLTGPTPPVVNRQGLVWFSHDREGAAWQGRSLLRPAYGPWLIKHETWRVHATSIRRFGMGIPSVEAPPGATAAQIIEAQRLASSARAGDQGGAGLPNGFTYRLTGMTGSVPDALAFIEYLDRQMTRMALASFLDLGTTPNGSRSLGDSFVDLFMLSLQGIADYMAGVITEDLSADIVRLNHGEGQAVPRVVCTDIGARQEITADALDKLLTSGALQGDEELEAWVRQSYSLPARTTPRTPPPAPAPPAPGVGARRARPVRAATSTTVLRRDLTPIEAAAKTDFAAVQDDWESALEALVKEWSKTIAPAARKQLIDQVTAAVKAGDMNALATLTVDVPGATDLLEQAMTDLADGASGQMVDEADAQGVTVPGNPIADAARLAAAAALIVALIGVGLAASAARKALQVWSTDATPADVADAVEKHLTLLTDASLKDNLGAGLSVAQNEGRLAVLYAAPEATYYASEVLDKNTCTPCAEIDGHQFTDLADADSTYASGGYSQCDGGLRCRGIVVTVWDTATGDTATMDQAA